ncbi:4a-hydroxytetrahydrobiopterin dehydratase [Paenibacillus sp. SYP-B4298]|uniref:4a-hydroxytetrahydrobiopterin dehydratase n=1 Tax=Paenibacillus sp. SYP-B4298 TaxID=2996034 RepID=UPI0022DDCDC8|nr:4a-hydroxytetrahydrobiopterin dehydratase [Paenibacillus sp. SYP-B4298]
MAKAERLSETEIERELALLAGWTREGEKRIRRSYLFASFPEAVAFTVRVAGAAERMQHHPFIAIDYRRVTLTYTTWHVGGLTVLDFESARACDALLQPPDLTHTT